MGDVLRPDRGIIHPITVQLGGRWSYTYTVNTPASWAGYSGKAQIRPAADEDAELLAELALDFTTPMQLTVTLSSVDTAAMTPGPVGVWDLYIQAPDGERAYLVETSTVEITNRVSRP